MNMITYEDFCRVELRLGVVVKVELFPRANKPAYKVWVDFGPEIGIKQTSAQITSHYALEDLPGRQVIGCVNLSPRNIAGFQSEFLLTGFTDDQGFVCLATVDGKIAPGKISKGQKLL